jgi:hypothetical protein
MLTNPQARVPDGVTVALEVLVRNCTLVSQLFDDSPGRASQHNEHEPLRFAEEVMRYHEHYRPHDVADLTYERIENTG